MTADLMEDRESYWFAPFNLVMVPKSNKSDLVDSRFENGFILLKSRVYFLMIETDKL